MHDPLLLDDEKFLSFESSPQTDVIGQTQPLENHRTTNTDHALQPSACYEVINHVKWLIFLTYLTINVVNRYVKVSHRLS